jgi:hypothetical protein
LIALAFLAALTMLPVYHRHHDGKLLMLAVPACALLYARRREAGAVAIFFTAVALALNSDIPRVVLSNLEKNLAFSVDTLSGKITTILLGRPASLAVLAMTAFYLWACWRFNRDPIPEEKAARATVGTVT